MEKYVYSSDSLIQTIWDGCSEWIWSIIIAFLISSFVTTRVITGFRNRPSQIDSEEPRTVRRVPYWLPWMGHGLSIAWDGLSYVRKARLAAVPPGFDEH